MNTNSSRARRDSISRKLACGIIVWLMAGIASSQTANDAQEPIPVLPDAEFQMARLKYPTIGGAGSHGILNPWWKVDAPFAEQHFLAALNRITNVSAAGDTVPLELTDDRIFDYPFLWLQQPGNGNWRPTPPEAARLRDYLLRGGFLLVDDFHGEYEWAVFEAAIRKVFPDRPIIEIPDDDPLMHVFYNLGDRVQIPGVRHLRRGPGGKIVARMQGPQHWRGIYDDRHRLIVAINFNMDMGDAWEHADDPDYPIVMTAQAYRLGINYVIYAMSH